MKLAPGSALKVALQWDDDVRVAVGRLAMRDRRAHFEYAADFLTQHIEISRFHLPGRPGVHVGPARPFDGLHGVFNDSLPDGWGRLLLDRRSLALGLNPAALSPLDRLAGVGGRGIGALVYEPDLIGDDTSRAVVLDELASDAHAVLDGAADEVLPQLLRIGGSPQGARPKALVNVRIADAHVVSGPDVHADHLPMLVKFTAKQDGPDAGAVELAYNQMAREAGIDVPEATLLPSEVGPGWFAARRFDRSGSQRLHAHTLCGLLHADHRVGSLDYLGAMRATHHLCGDQRAVEEMVRRMMFNVLAHNRDDHTKQFSYLMDRDGRWRLAPAYDLTFSDGPGGEHSMTVAGEGRAPTATHLLRVAQQSGVRERAARRLLEQVRHAVASWRSYARESGVSAKTVDQVAARHTDVG